MAQDGTTAGGASYTLDNVTFPVGRTKLQSIFDAIRTTNIGNDAPDLVAGQFWIDNNTPSTTVWTLYFYDGTDSIQFATIDTINNTVNFTDSAFDLVVDTTPQLGGDLDLNSNDITGTGNINITGTIESSGNITGTLATASQPNITSVGTLTGLTTTGNINFGDNDKAVFGAGSDLQIYHDGSNSLVEDIGTGDLRLKGTQVRIRSAGDESVADFLANSSVNLYYDNAEKLATTSTGIDVTGTVTASTGVEVEQGVDSMPSVTGSAHIVRTDGSGTAPFNQAGSLLYLPRQNDTDGRGNHYFYTGATPKLRQNIAPNGDISFYEDTGTTAKLFWDASAESLGIGTSSPAQDLHIVSSAPDIRLEDSDNNAYALISSADGSLYIQADDGNTVGSSVIAFQVDNTESMRISNGGQVGIGTTSGDSRLVVVDTNKATASNGIVLIRSSDSGADYGGQITLGNEPARRASIAGRQESASGTAGYLQFGTRGSSGDITERMRIDSSGNVGIGTSSPDTTLHVNHGNDSPAASGTMNTGIVFASSDSSRAINIGSGDSFGGSWINSAYSNNSNSGNPLAFLIGTSEAMRIDSSGNVGIGTSSPDSPLTVKNNGTGTADAIELENFSGESSYIKAKRGLTLSADYDNNSTGTQSNITFETDASEAMRIDSSGNVLFSTTSTPDAVVGASGSGMAYESNGFLGIARAGTPLIINRRSTDGEIIAFKKDGTTVGSIGSKDANSVYIENSNCGFRFYGTGTNIIPCGTAGASRDNIIDLGNVSVRFDDIYATNGTIQTSDQNEKQSIQSLTASEIAVAQRISKLFKTFKWNSAVEKKGDSARTHTGIISQDVQQAFSDEGLDASNYALFISSTWWEKEISVDAVAEELDDEGNVVVEGKDAYTYMDTKEEATEGYTERTRLGIRYPELLSFVSSAFEQRLTNIETRLTALET